MWTCRVWYSIASLHNFSRPSVRLFLKWEPIDGDPFSFIFKFLLTDVLSLWALEHLKYQFKENIVPKIKVWSMLPDTANSLWDPEKNTKFGFLSYEHIKLCLSRLKKKRSQNDLGILYFFLDNVNAKFWNKIILVAWKKSNFICCLL